MTIEKMNDEAEAARIIVDAPEISPGEIEAAARVENETVPEAEKPATVAHEPPPIDRDFADMGGRAIGEMLRGFDIRATPTVEELSGTLMADVAAMAPAGGSRMGRVIGVGVLLGLVIAPPILRVLGVFPGRSEVITGGGADAVPMASEAGA